MNKTWKKILMPLIGLLAMLMMTCMVQARPAKVTKMYGTWYEGSSQIQIRWGQVSGMKGSRKYYYRIYNRNGKVVRTGVANRRYTDGTIGALLKVSNNRTIYGFAVRGRTGNSYGPWSAKKWLVPQPVSYSGYYTQNGSYLKTTIKWNAVAGAYKGYKVYWSRSSSSGYSYLGTTKGTSWTKNLSIGYHYFIIQPVANSSAASAKNIYYRVYVYRI